MNVRDLIPWQRGASQPSLLRNGDRDPFVSLHREMNRLFDDAFRSFDGRLPGLAATPPDLNGSWPSVEISETEKEIKVTAEVPGLEEKDIEILLNGDVLTLKGEKRSEAEDKDRQFSEFYYGSFERRIPLGFEIEEDKIDARFKNGVLTVTLPKSEQAQSQVKRISIKH